MTAPGDTRGAPSAPEHVYLIDGSGFIFRAFHALPPMSRADGTPVNAVYGFTNMLMKLIEDTDADHIAVIFDAARKTFRNDIYPQYKANRPPPPDDLVPQFALITALVEAFNLPAVKMPGFEADDLIATYARQARERGARVTIVSSDKDLMQLVGDRVRMLDTMRNRDIGPDGVVEKFGVGPDKVIEVQALAGDSVDNVPGVPGIGVKTAALLINEYGDLETLLARAGEIKQPKRRQNLIEFADLARLSRELVTLKDDVPVEQTLDSFAVREPDPEILLPFLREQGFKSLVARIESRLGDTATPPAAPQETNYELIQDEAALIRWIDAATKQGHVAIDTETTSLDAMQAELVGVSMALVPGSACYIPLAHKAAPEQGALDLDGGGTASSDSAGAPRQIDRARAVALLKPMLEDAAILKIGHNIKYDAQILAHHDIAIAPVDDTMLLSFVLDGGRHGHGLDELALAHFDHRCTKFTEVAGTGRKQITFDYVALSVACDYAAEDADFTLRLHRLLKARLIEDRMTTLYETVERPLIPVVAALERAGVLVDPEALIAMSRDFGQRMAAFEREIHQLAGREFNIASPKQLGEILFDQMSLPGAKKTKTGAYKTDARVLEDLASAGHALPGRIIEWRQLAKLKSTYADALVQQINPRTGRIHTSYAMASAQTGRMSSTDPNLQNIPIRTAEGRRIRKAFIAAKGHKLLSLDYSQIELRVLAHIAGIDALVQAFHDGLDIHAMTASEIFGVPIEGMDPLIRRNAKAINFGIIYGISAFGLARQLTISRTEAQTYIDSYFKRFPGIKDYMERAKEECRQNGHVTTLFGRRIHLPGILDKNPMRRNYAERQAINAPIQGSAADIIKRAMIRVPAALAATGLDAIMLLQVHDELLFEVPDSQLDQTATVIGALMEGAPKPRLELAVPLIVDSGIGDNWDEAH
jgi:DNA polymerase-1